MSFALLDFALGDQRSECIQDYANKLDNYELCVKVISDAKLMDTSYGKNYGKTTGAMALLRLMNKGKRNTIKLNLDATKVSKYQSLIQGLVQLR